MRKLLRKIDTKFVEFGYRLTDSQAKALVIALLSFNLLLIILSVLL